MGLRKNLVLLGRSHLFLQADHPSADISSSCWLLTPVWELHIPVSGSRNLLSKTPYTFPETFKKLKYSNPLFQNISQDSSKVEISLNHPTQPQADPTVDFAAELAVCSLLHHMSPGHTAQAAWGTRALWASGALTSFHKMNSSPMQGGWQENSYHKW